MFYSRVNCFAPLANVLALAFVLVTAAPSMAEEPVPGDCDQRTHSVLGSGLPLQDQLGQMLALEGDCAGSGIYEYLLSKLYISTRDYESATQTIVQGLESESSYDRELLSARGDIYLHKQDYKRAASEYLAVTEAFPDWYAGHDKLGLALFAQGQNEEAISSLNQSILLQKTASAFRTLTLAYYLTGQFEESTKALDGAYNLDKTILGDRDPMVAAIRSYAELGNYQVSYGLLGTLLKENPRVREDPEYQRAGLFLRQKMIDAGLIAEPDDR